MERPKSKSPRNAATTKTNTITTTVVPVVCFLVGQVTFFNSTLTSRKNSTARAIGLADVAPTSPPACFALTEGPGEAGLTAAAEAAPLPSISASFRFFFSVEIFFFCNFDIYHPMGYPQPGTSPGLGVGKWQVRRESNPQQPDLESGALPIGATDLQITILSSFLCERDAYYRICSTS